MRTRGAFGGSKGAAAPEEQASEHGEGSGDTVETATKEEDQQQSREIVEDGENGDQRRLACV